MQQRILVATSAAHGCDEALRKLGAEFHSMSDAFLSDKDIEDLVAHAAKVSATSVVIDLCYFIPTMEAAFTSSSVRAADTLVERGFAVFFLTRATPFHQIKLVDRLWKHAPATQTGGKLDCVILDCGEVPHRDWESILGVASQYGPQG